jgi:hypothetical protein
MPCLIRIIARLHDPHAVSGANDAAIDAIELVTINDDNITQLNGIRIYYFINPYH